MSHFVWEAGPLKVPVGSSGAGCASRKGLVAWCGHASRFGDASQDELTAGLWTNPHFTFDVGMSGIGSPGWVVGCRVSEQERVGGVLRAREPIFLSCEEISVVLTY